MNDTEIDALRSKLAARPRSDDYRQRRKDIDRRGLEYGLAPDVAVEQTDTNGVRAEWNSTQSAARGTLSSFICTAAVLSSVRSTAIATSSPKRAGRQRP
jgi:hypothetical protein